MDITAGGIGLGALLIATIMQGSVARVIRGHMFGVSMNVVYPRHRYVRVFLTVCVTTRRPAVGSKCAGIFYEYLVADHHRARADTNMHCSRHFVVLTQCQRVTNGLTDRQTEVEICGFAEN